MQQVEVISHKLSNAGRKQKGRHVYKFEVPQRVDDVKLEQFFEKEKNWSTTGSIGKLSKVGVKRMRK